MALELPLPQLAERTLGALHIVTDDALALKTGVRVAFTGRVGGVSEGPYASLNLGSHVHDDAAAVVENRRLLADALGVSPERLIVPNQVHGTNLVTVDSADAEVVATAAEQAASPEGADGIIVSAPDVAALLCFADCVPAIIVSPTGRFAVVHAGWRGVEASIAPKAVAAMARADASAGAFADEQAAAASYNVYLGPHIHGECFETGADVHKLFVTKFGEACAVDARRIDLKMALSVDLARVGVASERIVDAGICTVCNSDEYFSYRASGGVCGRHGAVAVRKR